MIDTNIVIHTSNADWLESLNISESTVSELSKFIFFIQIYATATKYNIASTHDIGQE